MKRFVAVLLLLTMSISLLACSGGGWKGFYEEELSKYIDVADYNGLTYTVPDTSASDAELDARISQMLSALAELNETDKAAADGMTVTFDAYCLIDGTSYPEYSFESVTYELGASYSDLVISQILLSISGMKKGDGKDAEATLPVDYINRGDPEKNATYRITVLAVYEKVPLELTDATASMLVSGCNSVQALRTELRSRMERDKQLKAEDAVMNELKSKLISASTLKSTPYSVYNSYYEDRMGLYEKLAEAALLSLEQYVASKLNMTLADLENIVSDAAKKDTKEILVLYSIVKKENIECTEDDLTEYASRMALRSEGVFESGEEYLTYYGENAVKTDYLWSKVLELVKEKASPEAAEQGE